MSEFNFSDLHSIQSALRDSKVIVNLLRKERTNRGFDDTPTVSRIDADIKTAITKITDMIDKLHYNEMINLGS